MRYKHIAGHYGTSGVVDATSVHAYELRQPRAFWGQDTRPYSVIQMGDMHNHMWRSHHLGQELGIVSQFRSRPKCGNRTGKHKAWLAAESAARLQERPCPYFWGENNRSTGYITGLQGRRAGRSDFH